MSTAVPGSNTMDRGAANPVLEAHIASAKTLSIRQTRKGWCQECLGCEAKDEFKFFKQGELCNITLLKAVLMKFTFHFAQS